MERVRYGSNVVNVVALNQRLQKRSCIKADRREISFFQRRIHKYSQRIMVQIYLAQIQYDIEDVMHTSSWMGG